MKVAIVGYGRMGREVESILASRGHQTAALIDPVHGADHGSSDGGDQPRRFSRLDTDALRDCDVAIEFSLPPAVLDNVRIYAEVGCPAVVGTTGWFDHIEAIRPIVENSSAGLVYGSNFSIGAHVFISAARYAASLVASIEEYDLQIHEVHHRKKKDSPSGTALTLARAVLDAVPRKTTIETNRFDREPLDEELHVSSGRIGSVPGTHTLTLDSEADTIEIRHQARHRGGFALGAVLAAEWIRLHPGLHTVEEFVKDLIGGSEGAGNV